MVTALLVAAVALAAPSSAFCQIVETWAAPAPPPGPPPPPPVSVVPEFTLGGSVFSRAIGGYTISGSGVGGSGSDAGLVHPLFAGGTLRAGILIDRTFALGAVGFVHGLLARDAPATSTTFASQLMLSDLIGGGGGLELGSVLPLGRLALRSTVTVGAFGMAAPVAGSAHTCMRTSRYGSYTGTCYNYAGMFAPFVQVRLAADYEVVDDVSVGVEGSFDLVPWWGWSAGVYVRLHLSHPSPPRRSR